MKKIISTIALFLCVGAFQAQVPDSTRHRMKTAPEMRTDSVRNGNEVYNGSKSRKSKSNGDTLTAPKSNSKSGSMNPKSKSK